MMNHACLAAIALMTGSVTGGMALGHYATGNWHLQHAAALETADVVEEEPMTHVPHPAEQVAFFGSHEMRTHVCRGCDAGRHLRRAGESLSDAYADDYGAEQPPIAPDAFETEADWGGGRPVRAEAPSYQVMDATAPDPDSTRMDGEATVMASATPPRLPVQSLGPPDARSAFAAN